MLSVTRVVQVYTLSINNGFEKWDLTRRYSDYWRLHEKARPIIGARGMQISMCQCGMY